MERTETIDVSSAVSDYLSLVKFSHSIFALPFAWIGLILATSGAPGLSLVLLMVLAAVLARTAAMAFNRYHDREIDAKNPRTRSRELPSGKISATAALGLTIGSCSGFLLVAYLIDPLCFYLTPVVLLVILGYSMTKSFTWACHLVLGAALGLAPLGAWIAGSGTLDGILGAPLLLFLAVATWVAGFDVIYACQDADFDRQEGLLSIPARFGVARALRISLGLHVVTVLAFVAFGLLASLGLYWWIAVALASLLLIHEHRIVAPDDLSRVNAAFFTMNGVLSLVMALLGSLDYWL